MIACFDCAYCRVHGMSTNVKLRACILRQQACSGPRRIPEINRHQVGTPSPVPAAHWGEFEDDSECTGGFSGS